MKKGLEQAKKLKEKADEVKSQTRSKIEKDQ